MDKYEFEIEVQCPECRAYLSLFNGLFRKEEKIYDTHLNKYVTSITELIRCLNCDSLVPYDSWEK